MSYELDIARMEASRNEAEDAYFAARPHLDTKQLRSGFNAGYQRGWDNRNKEVMALQAKIDALMLEFCPKEMTIEQMKAWEKHQVGAPRQSSNLTFNGA